VLPLELPHADAARARAANPAALSIFRIGILPFTVLFSSQLKLRTSRPLGSADVRRWQARSDVGIGRSEAGRIPICHHVS
jgi:hypothetical protein